MKIAFIVTGLSVGGAEAMLLKLVTRLDRTRFESVVISLTDIGAIGDLMVKSGIRVESLGIAAGSISIRGLLGLRKLLKIERPDLLQGWMYHGNLVAVLGRFLSVRKVPVLWNVRGMNAVQAGERWRSRLAYRLSGLISRFADKIVNNSRASAAAHELALGYPATARAIIPNGFDTELFAPRTGVKARARAGLGLPPDGVVMGLIGRYHPDKDVPNLLDAARIALARDPSLHFVLAGTNLDDGNRELGNLILNTGTPEKFHALGQRDDIPDVLAALDVVVLSSRGENFPNAIGEAMSCGIPCVVTDVGDCRTLVGDTGLIVPPGDSGLLAAAIIELAEMRAAARATLGSRARQRIVERYSLDSVVRQYENLYRQVHDNALRG